MNPIVNCLHVNSNDHFNSNTGLRNIDPSPEGAWPVHDLKGDAKARYVAGMFARIARRYDLLNTVMTGGMHHRWRKLAARLATEGVNGVALDVATGTGDFAFALAKRPGVHSAVGVDFVAEMVALARLKAQRRHASEKVRFAQADALSLPFPDDTFICATSGFSMRNVTDVARAVQEMARVVRPGGRVVILEISPFERDGLFPRLFRFYFHRVVPLVGGILSGDREAYTYLPRSVDIFLHAPELARLMEEAGLENVSYRKAGMGSVAVHVGEKR